MKRLHLDIHRRPPWLLLVAAALTVTACQPREGGPRPTPPPPFASFAAASRADLMTYAHSLQFDTNGLAADAQYLAVPHEHQLVKGPYAALAPEIGAATIHDAFTPGHFLARLELDSALPEAKLPRGVTYIWVDSIGTAPRAVLVPENDSFPVVPATVTTTALCSGGLPCCLRATARFEVEHVHTDSTPLMTCHPCDTRICCDMVWMRALPSAGASRAQERGALGKRTR